MEQSHWARSKKPNVGRSYRLTGDGRGGALVTWQELQGFRVKLEQTQAHEEQLSLPG